MVKFQLMRRHIGYLFIIYIMNKEITPAQVADFSSEFSNSKFWTKVKGMVSHAGKKLVYIALLLYYVMESSQVSYQQKALIISALGYLICPVDFVPDFIPVAGYSDDLTALVAVYKLVKNNITPDMEVRAKAKVESMF